MSIDLFWKLIEECRAKSGDFDDMIDSLTNYLIGRSEQEIVDFELRLRELLLKAYHFNVMAVQKIVEGYVSDDSFLYFRCKLILYGKNMFETAIKDPNDLVEKIDPEANAESLLYVADKAFLSKFGEDTDKVLPRDRAYEIIDYDGGNYDVEGEDWETADLPVRYPKLWNAYH